MGKIVRVSEGQLDWWQVGEEKRRTVNWISHLVKKFPSDASPHGLQEAQRF